MRWLRKGAPAASDASADRMVRGASDQALQRAPSATVLSAEEALLRGVAGMPSAITLNGTRVKNSYRYEGRDGTASGVTARGAGADLAVEGILPLPVPNQAVPTNEPRDKSVLIEGRGSHYYGAAAGIGLGDMWATILFMSSAYTTTNQCLTETNQGTSPYWELRLIAANLAWFRCVASSTVAKAFTVPGSGNWTLIELCWNRDEASAYGMSVFVNGVYLGGSDFSALASDDLTGALPLRLLGCSLVSYDQLEGYWALSQVFSATDWFLPGVGGYNEALALHQSRYARLGLS